MIRLVASGQSNALGRDSRSHPPLSGRVQVWDSANDIETLDDLGSSYRLPEVTASPFARGAMSPLVFAAGAIAGQLDDDVSLVLVAKGATPVEKWSGPGRTAGPMYRRLLAVARRAGAHPYDALLWHQGEADDKAADEYSAKFLQLVRSLRSEGVLGETAPVLVGETAAQWTNINAILRTLPDLDPTIRFVSLADLPTYDGVHFPAAAGPEIGRRYAEAFRRAAVTSPS